MKITVSTIKVLSMSMMIIVSPWRVAESFIPEALKTITNSVDALHHHSKRSSAAPFLVHGKGHLRTNFLSLYVNDNTSSRVQGSLDDATKESVIDNTKFAQIQGLANKDPSEVKTFCCGQEGVSPALVEKMMRIIKPRAYPLFILEKIAKTVEDVARSLTTNPNETERGSMLSTKQKERLVILGTGWGAMSLLKDDEIADRYEVTVISPRNFFLFTPMLAGASVGTVEARTVTEPIREINRKAKYLEATATSIDKEARTVTCKGEVCEEECSLEEFTVPYDRLVVAVGATTNTFGIPGVKEHCAFLKQVQDARKIRRKIINLFERANYPGLTGEERQDLLTFAVIGAGPTGVEFVSELRDFIEQDGPKYYPDLLKYASIKLVDGSPTVLQPFDKSLQDAAIEALTRKLSVKDRKASNDSQALDLTEIILEKQVKEVKQGVIVLSDETEIPYGLAVWAGGIGPLPLTLDIIQALGEPQTSVQCVARGKIAVDPWLRALGGDGRIFSIGDCACTQDKCLPSNAQVANQQGEYLGQLFCHGNFTAVYQDGALLPPTRNKDLQATLAESIAAFAMNNNEYAAPFQFLDMGILAYTGASSALAQIQATPNERTRITAAGQLGFGLWRSVYFYKQASMRNRVLVSLDWAKSKIFGRDITELD